MRLWASGRFSQICDSLRLQLSGLLPRGLRQMMGREEERDGWLSLSLSPRLRIYSPRLEEVRLVDGPVEITVIFGQRGDVDLNGCEKRRVRVELWSGAPPARERLEWVNWAAAVRRVRGSNSIHGNRIGQNSFSCHMEARGRGDGDTPTHTDGPRRAIRSVRSKCKYEQKKWNEWNTTGPRSQSNVSYVIKNNNNEMHFELNSLSFTFANWIGIVAYWLHCTQNKNNVIWAIIWGNK